MDRPPAGSQPHKGVKCNVAKVCQFWRLAVQVSLRAVRPVPAQQGLEARHLPSEARLAQGELHSPCPQRPHRADNFSVPPQLSEPQHSHIPSSFLLREQEHLRGIVDKLSVYYLTSSRHFNFANRNTTFSPLNIMYDDVKISLRKYFLIWQVGCSCWFSKLPKMSKSNLLKNKVVMLTVHQAINPTEVSMRIFGNGTVVYTMRRHLILNCEGDLPIFPFDSPMCDFNVESSKITLYNPD